VLLATVFPLVMRKAFGRAAGMAAMMIALLAIGTTMALPLKIVFPAMVVLGPLMVLQYIYWRRQRGQERTTQQYLQEEPLGLHGISSRPQAGAVVR
jgi:membrane protein implicated in regulation of membrane protease activity